MIPLATTAGNTAEPGHVCSLSAKTNPHPSNRRPACQETARACSGRAVSVSNVLVRPDRKLNGRVPVPNGRPVAESGVNVMMISRGQDVARLDPGELTGKIAIRRRA